MFLYCRKKRTNVSEVKERYGKEQSKEYAPAKQRSLPNILAGKIHLFLFTKNITLGQTFITLMLAPNFQGQNLWKTFSVPKNVCWNFCTKCSGPILFGPKYYHGWKPLLEPGHLGRSHAKALSLTRTNRKLLAIPFIVWSISPVNDAIT